MGKYRFSPYLENLKFKGRDNNPRLISIPTIRDRIVLNQVNQVLAAVFSECVPRNIANSYIRSIASDLSGAAEETTYICGCDIKTFYDSIQHNRLLGLVEKKCDHAALQSLVKHAILTPTVPRNTRRQQYPKYKNELGVPQGLAISNILSAIYMEDVDTAMESNGVTYYRYVDDVLMYGSEGDVRKAYTSLRKRFQRRGLTLHTLGLGKTYIAPLTSPFGYLGYIFKWPHITVRDATIERLLQSFAAKFSDYLHNKERRLRKLSYLNDDRLKEIFLLELNERITGAISEGRRYGWIAYFSQVNDLSLLHRVDHTVTRMFERLAEFGNVAPSSLKKIRRAYFEMKYNPHGGYVRDYDAITTRVEKLAFLVERGRVGPTESLTDEAIEARYQSYLQRILAAMHADEGAMYG
jgi:hypothetical protein